MNDSNQSDELPPQKQSEFNEKPKRPRPKTTWQLHGESPKGETTIVIGFDFGTSCTKIIIQDVVLKKAYAIPFDGLGCSGNPYLLPTSISIDRDGNFSLNRTGKTIDGLKLKFLQGPDHTICHYNGLALNAAEASSAYIGLVLQEIRRWFWQEKHSDYQNFEIDWQLNIGMSSRSYDDHVLKNQIKRVALAGWNLTLVPVDRINISHIRKAIATAESQELENNFDELAQQLHPDYVCPIPEIIAQVVGFARSPMRQDGMYLMVDVGASTIDVSNFIIHKSDEEDLYTILVAEVEKLGVLTLHQYRISCAENIIRKFIGEHDVEKFRINALKTINSSFDGIVPPPKIENYFPAMPEEALDDFQKRNEEFIVECSKIVRKVIKESMFRRNPYSSAWQNGLPVFLCGGGSMISTYKNIIPHAGGKLSSTSFFGFEQKQLPKPANLETADIPPRDYHRMSVAYGLSFSSIDIGGIIPPGSIPDLIIRKKIRDISNFYIDKDMV